MPDIASLFPIASPRVLETLQLPFPASDETLLRLEEPVQVIVGSSHGTTSYIAPFGSYSDAIISVTHADHRRFLSLLLLSMPHWKIPLSIDIDKDGRIRHADFYAFLWQDRQHEFWANPKFKLCLSLTFGVRQMATEFVTRLAGTPFAVVYDAGP
jgi:hypothetical protein